jgi:UDP-N-acetylglucosamine--N-acetylmuramyl-(pentapeptide) pyrophosphoryl-undecaprenol N-acetylglucosamine transferase
VTGIRKAQALRLGSGQAPRIVLAGGGTGGHVYPALAVAAELRRKRPEARFLFIGGDRLEARLVPAAKIPFTAIAVHGLAGRGLSAWMRRARAMVELAIGLPLWQSVFRLRRFRAQVVIGTGGYASGPVLLAARLLRIPSLALEGNRTPGMTSRLVARMVSVMAVGWPDQAEFFRQRVRRRARVVVTGLPVRRELLETTREEGAAALGFDPALLTLLVLGGSLGSQRINDAVVGALKVMSKREDGRLETLQVLHVTGGRRYAPWPGPPVGGAPSRSAEGGPRDSREGSPGGTPRGAAERTAEAWAGVAGDELLPYRGRYRAVAYLNEYWTALAAADLVICRAGASTVAELAARGVPAILIPWSGASTGEQELNARALAKAGAAIVIPDEQLTAERLAVLLDDLLWNAGKRQIMGRASKLLGRPEAGEQVADLALELIEGR